MSLVGTRKQAVYRGGAFALCFVVGGWFCWRGSYPDYLNAGFDWKTLAMLASVAAALPWFGGTTVKASGLVVGSVLPAVIVVRVVEDCIPDPTNHNLWPFEVGIAIALGMLTAFPAATLGKQLRRLTHRGDA